MNNRPPSSPLFTILCRNYRFWHKFWRNRHSRSWTRHRTLLSKISYIKFLAPLMMYRCGNIAIGNTQPFEFEVIYHIEKSISWISFPDVIEGRTLFLRIAKPLEPGTRRYPFGACLRVEAKDKPKRIRKGTTADTIILNRGNWKATALVRGWGAKNGMEWEAPGLAHKFSQFHHYDHVP